MRYFLIGLLIVAFISCQSQQTGQTTLIKSLETSEDSLGYSLGQQMAKSIKSGSGKFNDEALLQGVMDALNDSESKLTDAEIQKHYKDFRTILAEEQQKIRQQQASENMAEAEEFLEANKNEEGVVTLPSGLQYKVIEKGSGKSPDANDMVTVHYTGTLIDGSKFDSSRDRGKPATFQVNRVIPGWTEALQKMKEGSHWKLFIPPDLAYGQRGARGRIEPNSALIFDVELLEVQEKGKTGN